MSSKKVCKNALSIHPILKNTYIYLSLSRIADVSGRTSSRQRSRRSISPPPFYPIKTFTTNREHLSVSLPALFVQEIYRESCYNFTSRPLGYNAFYILKSFIGSKSSVIILFRIISAVPDQRTQERKMISCDRSLKPFMTAISFAYLTLLKALAEDFQVSKKRFNRWQL